MGEPLVDANERETFGSEGRAIIGSLSLAAAASAQEDEDDETEIDLWRPNSDRNSSPHTQSANNTNNGRPRSPCRYRYPLQNLRVRV